MHFVGNLILNTSCEFYYDDVTVPLFMNIKCGDICHLHCFIMNSIPLLFFLWAKTLTANQLHFEMHPVYE